MAVNWWLLIGILIIVVGFSLKIDSIAVVIVSAIVTALIGGIDFGQILEILGEKFVANRGMSIFILTLPIVGISERFGLKESAVKLIQSIKRLTAGRLLWLYQIIRQFASAFSLRLGGHPQFVRPLIHPMAEGAAIAQRDNEALSEKEIDTIKGAAAASDNYANFFGQMVFPASSGVALIVGTMVAEGYDVTNTQIGLWSIPVFIVALIIGFIQFMILDKKLGGKKR